ncbi:MAG: glutamine amidotransferase [Planctomycetota bacterium]
MGDISFSFEYPWFLVLLVLIPILWIVSYSALSGLGKIRRISALLLRSTLFLLLILALAGIQWVWISDKTTVIYLLDQSDSIPATQRSAMLKYAISSVREHRDSSRGDMAGLIVFGAEAVIEFPPYDDNLPPIEDLESYFGKTDATNLESALKLAQASFPEDTAKRIVIVTDGNETIGTGFTVAKSLADKGIGIDVVPIKMDAQSEILVEKIDIPSNIRQGQPFETKVVINKYQVGEEKKPVAGYLNVYRSIGARKVPVYSTPDDDPILLENDVNVFPIRDTIQQPAGYTYQAEFIPVNSGDDSLKQNNRADAYTYVRGKGRVLLIEDWNAQGEYAPMIESLRASDIEVDVQASNNLFTTLLELQAYDCVILAGVPKSSGDDANSIASFSEEQIEMLVTNLDLGCGLLMLGSPNAFGAGGWTNTKVEEAMPVDFQIKNDEVQAVGALAMILHAAEIAQGNYWQKRIGQAALEVLGPMDYCGIINYGSLGDSWLWSGSDGVPGLQKVGASKKAMINRLRRMVPGDMPDFQPSMQMCLKSLVAVNASIKHMIIISDGDPQPPQAGVLTQFANAGIKISTVAVGAHGPAGHNTLQNIATKTGGNYYVARNPTVLPKIFQREAMRVSKPLVHEPEGGLMPQITSPHPIVQGLPRDLPNLKGFVLTSIKDSPLVEVPIRTSVIKAAQNQAVLATWLYGAGKAGVFTSDAGRRWAGDWTKWPGYDQFFAQLVRYHMRPTESDAKFTVATNVKDGKAEIVVNALNQEDEFLNFLDMQAVAISPDMKQIPLSMRQTAPGRYVGSFDAANAGSYLVSILPEAGMAPITTGASVPFSDEYRLRKTNYNALERLAVLEPDGGNAGEIAIELDSESAEGILSGPTPKEFLQSDAYRGGLQKAMSLQDIWQHCLLIGAFCLFGDVFVRRVSLDYLYPFKWVYKQMNPGETSADSERKESLARLRSKKSEVSDEMQQVKASTRFEVTEAADTDTLEEAMSGKSQTSASAQAADRPSISQKEEDEGYTSRLLAAKKRTQKKTDKN